MGYKPPMETEGIEEFLHTNKGMWEQRIFGMEYVFSQTIHSKYLLVCDDDVAFDADFVEKILGIAEEYKIDTLVPIKDIKKSLLYNVIFGIMGDRTENKKSKFKITIKRNGRFSVNNNLKNNVNPTQSGPFACFLMRTDITPMLKLREEMWLDDTRYAWPDDQVFFYKANLLGFRTYSCKMPEFTHLDGKSGETDFQRKLDATYSGARNRVIFWNKFIKKADNTISTKLRFEYHLFIRGFYTLISSLLHRRLSLFLIYKKGIKDGKSYSSNNL